MENVKIESGGGGGGGGGVQMKCHMPRNSRPHQDTKKSRIAWIAILSTCPSRCHSTLVL